MDNGPCFGRLLGKSLLALLLCAALVTVCYFFVDRPVAVYIHGHNADYAPVLKWLTYPPPILQTWAPVVLVALMVRRSRGPFRRCELTLLAASVGIVLADQFKETLAIAFGRYWPETWIDNNPSLIGDGSYGFHPFHRGSAYTSFPSGHTARALSVAAVVWIGYPWWRWASLLASAAVVTGLVGMDYHFVGDVIAGAFVGGIVGVYTARGCGLNGQCPSTINSP